MFCCAQHAAGRGHSAGCETRQPAGACANHRVISHDAEGLERWCDFCGRDAEGEQVAKPAM